MKKLLTFLVICPFILFANDNTVPSNIKEVTVYLNGAQVTRSANYMLKTGTTELVFNGLSTKIDESSIQISGLESVSILSISYDINYLAKSNSHPEVLQWEKDNEELDAKIAFLKNKIFGLEEEQKVISTNRLVSSETQSLDLEKIRQISTYYRERTTAIKDEIFIANLEINLLKKKVKKLTHQLAEVNNAPEEQQGEITVKFDAPIATNLNLSLSYIVQDAGWIPSYDIRSMQLNAPLKLTYKALVYQKTGNSWDDVKVTLSTGNPNINVAQPTLGSKYLNFVSRYQKRYGGKVTKKNKYVYNPMVNKVWGTVTDDSGQPLPGCNVVIKGTSKGTQTDFDGNFSLEVFGGQELVFTYLGYNTKQIPIYASIINVRLEENALSLNEVIVTAQGVKREKNSLGYAVSSVIPEQRLQGKTAGIQIRGVSGISKSKPATPKLPLYIIDGVPSVNFVEGDLDENEIQSIEVLKGTNATTIYGNKGNYGVVVITTKKSTPQEDITSTKFIIKKPYTIASDGDITTIEINTYELEANYEYVAAPIINENVFLTASFTDWEEYNLLPGEANLYFAGAYAGKTTIDPYTLTKEVTVSLGTEPNITVARKQERNFKSKSFTGNNRVLNRTYELEVKNSKSIAIDLKLLDRIPLSQNKEIKVSEIETFNADYDQKKGLLTWKLNISPNELKKELFSFKVKYPRYKTISL